MFSLPGGNLPLESFVNKEADHTFPFLQRFKAYFRFPILQWGPCNVEFSFLWFCINKVKGFHKEVKVCKYATYHRARAQILYPALESF